MATIDKIYVNKDEAQCVIDLFKDLDKEYKEFFGTKSSLSNYLFFDDIEYWDDWEEEHPIMELPNNVEAWIWKVSPQWFKDIMMREYNWDESDIKNVESYEFDPIIKYGTRLKLIHKKNTFLWRYDQDKIHGASLYVSVYDPNDIDNTYWFPNEGYPVFKFNKRGRYVGGWSNHGFIYANSYKALVRQLRKKWKYPKGTIITITNRWIGFEIKFRAI